MVNVPSKDIQAAFIAPTSTLVRRVEIYEQNGVTPWKPELWSGLLVSGTVTVDYDRDERRNVDLELDNRNGDLNPVAGGLWYDKVFKVYYGIRLSQKAREVRVAIVEEYLAPGQANNFKQMLSDQGVKKVRYLPLAVTVADLEDYDVIVSIASTTPQKTALLTAAHAAGKSVLTLSMTSTAAQLPFVIGNAGAGTVSDPGERVIARNNMVHPISTGWDGWSMAGGQLYRKVLAPTAGGSILVGTVTDSTNGLAPAIVARQLVGGAKWMHAQQWQFNTAAFFGADDTERNAQRYQAGRFFARAMNWLTMYVPQDSWEVQIGEFLADGIQDSSDMGDRIKIVGRDMTKRCMNSKFAKATTFLKTQSIEEVIKAVASNAGIAKLDIPVTNKKLDKDTTWERGTSRWDVIKEIANANNYEIYFTASGYLTMRTFRDPLLTPPTLFLTTGLGGNLVSRGAKTSDSRLFNHIIVVGESSDSTIPPVFAEAINDIPGSSSSRAELGDRVNVVTSALVTTVPQAQELANSTLSVSALEEFELNFTMTLLPWAEPGEILEMTGDNDKYWGPDRYLISSINFPLDLTPMTGTGKRITKVV